MVKTRLLHHSVNNCYSTFIHQCYDVQRNVLILQGVMSQVSGSLNAEGGEGGSQPSGASLHEFLQPFDGGMFSEGEENSLFYQLFNTVVSSGRARCAGLLLLQSSLLGLIMFG